jgi:ankyrin repeat protein
MKTINLLDFNDIINYRDNEGNSMLINAVSRNDLPIIEKLLKLGADFNIINEHNDNVLTFAYDLDDKYLINTLFPQYKDKFNQENKSLFLKKLNNQEVEKYSQLYDLSDDNVRLFKAIKEDYLDEIKELLKKGVNPNLKNDEGEHPLELLHRKTIAQKIRILNCFKGYEINFLEKAKYTTLLTLVSANNKNSNKALLHIINNFGDIDFTKTIELQQLFHRFNHSDEEYQKYFLNKINKKNYQSINLSIVLDSSHIDSSTKEKVFYKFFENNWKLNYQINKSPAIMPLAKKHGYYPSLYNEFITRIDLNEEYQKDKIVYFDLIKKFAPFDQTKMDLTKIDDNGNNALMMLFELHTDYIIDKNCDACDTQYARDLFDYLIHHEQVDIYHKNKNGQSILSQIIAVLTDEHLYRISYDRKDVLIDTLKEVLKNKGYDDNFMLEFVPLEQGLIEALSEEDVMEIQKTKLEKTVTTQKNGKKLKI